MALQKLPKNVLDKYVSSNSVEAFNDNHGISNEIEKEGLSQENAETKKGKVHIPKPIPSLKALPEFDPSKFTPGYVPKTVKKGSEEYMIVVSGVKDTGLCGGYWGNTENLGSRRKKSTSKLEDKRELSESNQSKARRQSSLDSTKKGKKERKKTGSPKKSQVLSRENAANKTKEVMKMSKNNQNSQREGNISKSQALSNKLPEFDPSKFTPGYVPKTVKKGNEEYMIVVSGVKDTGLCGGYWGNTENLGSRNKKLTAKKLEYEEQQKNKDSTINKREKKETQKLKEYKLHFEKQKNRLKNKERTKSKQNKDEVYIIESLIEREGKGSYFLVKWENYGEDWNSWEPRSEIPSFIVEVRSNLSMQLTIVSLAVL